jgi:hypothetical protein
MGTSGGEGASKGASELLERTNRFELLEPIATLEAETAWGWGTGGSKGPGPENPAKAQVAKKRLIKSVFMEYFLITSVLSSPLRTHVHCVECPG